MFNRNDDALEHQRELTPWQSRMIDDSNFRRGACHSAYWLRTTAQKLADEGKSTSEIIAAQADLLEVLQDWRDGMVKMPEGNPWEWTPKDLQEFIAKRKMEW